MIRVEMLTKRFGQLTAVDRLSFEVQRGEIVGFLGPNGAGKTTTLRMLTGFLAPTSGEIWIAGRNLAEDPLRARRRLGYLPEHCPLPPDLRVREYLRHRAALKGVPAGRVRARVRDTLDLCGLGDMSRRMIGQLSKGYRQRVGLADALVHEPELLILDEPTLGLDPNQIRQAREFLRGLARTRTVLLSSHILTEIEAVCGRVLILRKGRLAAADTTASLRAQLQRTARLRLETRAAPDALRAAVAAIPGAACALVEAAADDPDWIEAEIEGGDPDLAPALARLLAERGWPLRALRPVQPSLEDVFHAVTRGGAEGRP